MQDGREMSMAGGPVLLALIVVLVCGCGTEPVDAPSVPPPAEESAEVPMPPLPVEDEELPDQLVGVPGGIDGAWTSLHDEHGWIRRHGIEQMLKAGATMEELVRHAAREARLDRDVGLLADLLAGYPKEAVPLVCERNWRTHNVGRAKLMKALGHRRPESGHAAGILLVRTAASEDPEVRRAAFRSLAALVPGRRLPEHLLIKADGETLGLTGASALAAQPENERTWTETALWSSFFVALHVEREHYGDDVCDELMAFLRSLPLTNRLRARVALAVAVDGPNSRFAADLLVDAGSAGFDTAQKLLRDRQHLHAALRAAPRMGGRATLLVEDILPLLEEGLVPIEALSALAAYGSRMPPEAQSALYRIWLAREREEAEGARPEWAWGVRVALQVSRARGAFLQEMLQVLEAPDASVAQQCIALEALSWAHASERERANEAIAAFVAGREALDRAPRRLRVSLASAQDALARPEAWFASRAERMIDDGLARARKPQALAEK